MDSLLEGGDPFEAPFAHGRHGRKEGRKEMRMRMLRFLLLLHGDAEDNDANFMRQFHSDPYTSSIFFITLL